MVQSKPSMMDRFGSSGHKKNRSALVSSGREEGYVLCVAKVLLSLTISVRESTENQEDVISQPLAERRLIDTVNSTPGCIFYGGVILMKWSTASNKPPAFRRKKF